MIHEWTVQITCIYFNELPSCSLSSFSSSNFFVCPTITVFLMSFTSTIHYVVLLISNKNLPLKRTITKYCAHLPPHINNTEEILPASLVAPLPNSEQINNPSSNHIYTKLTPNHIHHHYAPSVTLTHATHIISSTAPTYAPHYHPWICGRPAGVTALLARWTQ